MRTKGRAPSTGLFIEGIIVQFWRPQDAARGARMLARRHGDYILCHSKSTARLLRHADIQLAVMVWGDLPSHVKFAPQLIAILRILAVPQRRTAERMSRRSDIPRALDPAR